jgi:hypothetical protein
MYLDIREPQTGKLLFRFDPERDLVEVQRRGVKTVVDLAEYRAPESAKEIDGERQGQCGSGKGKGARENFT